MDQAQELTQEWEGLGRLPEYLPSISSLILFNTSENPYNVLMSIDNLKGRDDDENYKPQDVSLPLFLFAFLSDLIICKQDQDDEIETPASLLGGSTLPSYQIADYSYKPVLVDVPDLDLPLFLPELGNVGESELYHFCLFNVSRVTTNIASGNDCYQKVISKDLASVLPPPLSHKALSHSQTQPTFSLLLLLYLQRTKLCLHHPQDHTETYQLHHRRQILSFLLLLLLPLLPQPLSAQQLHLPRHLHLVLSQPSTYPNRW